MFFEPSRASPTTSDFGRVRSAAGSDGLTTNKSKGTREDSSYRIGTLGTHDHITHCTAM